ncbi:glycosyltransferase [Mucilaginibacter calamicampi]|uniref:Glycosyltransferase n=1 Tax=Mucilaginibacter calamicampi TaxID=1302352 RepID=A0ABW2YUP2_9SPHI
MISVIVATRNNQLLQQLSDNIQKSIGLEYEIIAINGDKAGKGICRIYNEGAAKAQYPFLCFVHEDILFHTQGWGLNLLKHLRQEDIALVGVLGATVKTRTPSEVFIPVDNLVRFNQLQRRTGKTPEHYFYNPNKEDSSEVKVVDGLFLACTQVNHARYPFDEQTLKGFHGYDIDFSLGQANNGKVVVVYDILLEHFSYGGHSVSWIDDQMILLKKWHAELPAYLPSAQKSILKAEINSTEGFLLDLILNRYSTATQLSYLLKLLALRPFNSKNIYFIRRFFIRGTLGKQLKKLFSSSVH